MTTQRLGRTPHPDTTGRGEPAEAALGALGSLFEHSPSRPVHTSAAAVVGLVTGLVAVAASPFTLLAALCLGLGAVSLVSSIIGLARASRVDVAGGMLAALGLVLSLAAFAVIGLRYAGIDTAVGDATVPTIADWLRSLNDLLPPT
jgi:hypothetical protein